MLEGGGKKEEWGPLHFVKHNLIEDIMQMTGRNTQGPKPLQNKTLFSFHLSPLFSDLTWATAHPYLLLYDVADYEPTLHTHLSSYGSWKLQACVVTVFQNSFLSL